MSIIYGLVDYDNVERTHRDKGIKYVIEKILDQLTPGDVVGKTHFKFRLYGGWYNKGSITTNAQKLTTQIRTSYPKIWTSIKHTFNLSVSVELAYSLLISPSEHLQNTMRKRKYSHDLKCNHPHNFGCYEEDCSLMQVFNGMTSKICMTTDCEIRVEDILEKSEQKLVDTMMSCDIFFLASKDQGPIVIVTSDDDFWPAIRTALQFGQKVIHIHTKDDVNATAAAYSKFANQNYFQRHI